jgi:hypothetical protein
MPQEPTAAPSTRLRAPLPPRSNEIAESLYWYPNELAVTVHAAKPPTLRQLRDLSARLHRLLSRVGISVLPFYSGGHRLSRGGAREGSGDGASPAASGGDTLIQVEEIEVGTIPTRMQVSSRLDVRWQEELQYCSSKKRLPGVHFFGEGQKGVAVVFYALRTHHRTHDTRRDATQVAVDFINQNLHLLVPHQKEARMTGREQPMRPLDNLLKAYGIDYNPENPDDPIHQKSLPVLAAMPNWLTSPLTFGGQPPTGPGAPPIEAEAWLKGGWEFKKQPFKNLINRAKTSSHKATIIVLDTFFQGGETDIEKRVKELEQTHANLLRDNLLLRDVLDDLHNGRLTINTTMKTISEAFRSGLDEYGRPFGYDMVDHGLFVVGILRGVLREVMDKITIELIRTQNDYGSGEMDLFLGALYEVATRPDLTNVVLNLSLGVLPALEELQTIWFGEECCCDGGSVLDKMQQIDLLHLGVRLPIEILVEKGAVIVAAAGNDSLGKTPAYGPRLPARYDDVLGVAAVDNQMVASGYSNRANLLSWGSGVATYGGEQPNDDSETLAAIARKEIKPADKPDAVEGLYLYTSFPPLSADGPPPTAKTNDYGTAWWSGTSFATPIVSGLAAHYILDGKQGQGVLNALLTDLVKANAPYEPRLQAPVLEVEEILV